MCRLAALVSVLTLLLSGCGGGSGDTSGGAGAAHASRSPSATYFGPAETAAINKAAGPAQQAGNDAQKAANLARCNRLGAKGYPQWRACWHGLLDPLQQSLNAFAAQLRTLASQDLPAACVSKLGEVADTFAAYATDVQGLLAGIDSDRRPRQVTAIHTYGRTLTEIAQGYTKPFHELTDVCFSPKELKRIRASRAASPSPSP